MENENKITPEGKEPNMVERAEKAAEALRIENDRKEKLLAEEKLSGNTGGHIEPEKPKEETPQEHAKRVQEGLKTGVFK